ncbi:PLP-dependent aminotransferase family protein [Oscillochloris sp. ZM17-4]|uniref:aminotransferase-like domain-containing protein n=1 Tax=Oscillochloris sp. ZM17-4 TaxID=2866714 RepID=UPI00351D91F4
MLSLAFGLADPALFPREELAAATAAVMADDAPAALNYGPSFAGLTDQVLGRLRAQGVEAEPENILVGYGSSQILALLPEVFVDRGDTVIIEGPSFMGAVRRFAMSGANLVTVPTDGEGMDVDALEVTLRELAARGVRPKFIYTIPTFHNPSGVTMPLARRQRLVALAAEHQVLVVEDDAYGELRFRGDDLPTLAALDAEGWVMRVCTYSKILAPGVRMGWAYARPEIIERLNMFKHEGGSGPFLTRVIARYAAEGRLDAHIAQLRDHYRQKCDLMLDAIGREFPAEVQAGRPDGGFFVWCRLPQGMRATALAERAKDEGVAFLPGVNCYANGQGEDAIRLAFSFQSAEKIQDGIARIGRAMRNM